MKFRDLTEVSTGFYVAVHIAGGGRVVLIGTMSADGVVSDYRAAAAPFKGAEFDLADAEWLLPEPMRSYLEMPDQVWDDLSTVGQRHDVKWDGRGNLEVIGPISMATVRTTLRKSIIQQITSAKDGLDEVVQNEFGEDLEWFKLSRPTVIGDSFVVTLALEVSANVLATVDSDWLCSDLAGVFRGSGSAGHIVAIVKSGRPKGGSVRFTVRREGTILP